MILPGRSIGILGGGQLGRMTALAARRLGYRIHVLDPAENCPAAAAADSHLCAPYEDEAALDALLARVDVLTYEFENVPAAAARRAATRMPVRPSPAILEICQNREREKSFLRTAGFPHAAFEVVASADELEAAIGHLGRPCVLKSADFGYDGKGQVKLAPGGLSAAEAWRRLGAPRGVIEAWIDFSRELSVLVARSPSGEIRTFPAVENRHTRHILDVTIAPGAFEPAVAGQARDLATDLARALDLEGLLAVELFLDRSNRLLVNELAPRPHNSGHYSLDAALTSQFEQHTRAVCGLPLGDPRSLCPAVMANLLGDLWAAGEPDWAGLLADPTVKLHLYGKARPAAGRKMGHFTVLDPDPARALERALRLKAELAAAAAPA
ncbi:MAG: 5-(carboxyamino)imidazole ribonucleotide synthase [Puniceicoccaceae bacterium]|nr:MAG: 5-(carboxyamino)imidazole ribonucleotide synthase [Puniceicoccaceae bacterium]